MWHAPLVVTGRLDQLRPAAARVADMAVDLGVESARHAGVELAVHECLANAREHGHLGDPTRPIVVEVTGAGGHAVVVRILDQALGGPWRPPPRPPDVRPAPSGGDVRGRGLVLVRACVDHLAVRATTGRTAVELRWVSVGVRATAVPLAERR